MNFVCMEKPVPEKAEIHEWLTINSRFFNGYLTLSNKFGSASAMAGGRILELMITENDCVTAYWKEEWQVPLPDLDPEAYLAYVYFVHKYNRVINERKEKEIFVHG